MNYEDLKQFLLESNLSSYASETVTETKELDGSTSIVFAKGKFRSHDNYFGGEPYGGRVVVFHQEKPVWLMVYYGQVHATISDLGKIYSFLKKALKKMPPDNPFRAGKLFSRRV